jgi:hypothetical protein
MCCYLLRRCVRNDQFREPHQAAFGRDRSLILQKRVPQSTRSSRRVS